MRFGAKTVKSLHLIGTAREKAGVLSFVLDGFRTEDVGAALNRQGIAVRAGHRCVQPILRGFGVESTVRPSLALYNTCEEIDALVSAIWNLKQGHTSIEPFARTMTPESIDPQLSRGGDKPILLRSVISFF